MSKKYNTKRIKADYTYSVYQIAELYSVDVQTVRRWIRDEGLQRIEGMRPHGVHSSELRRFIEKRNGKRKKPCKPYQIFCMKCQEQKQPQNGSAIAEHLPNGSIRINAKCNTCNTKMFRTVKGAEWSENHPLASFLAGAKLDPNRADTQPRECSLQYEMKLWLNLTH